MTRRTFTRPLLPLLVALLALVVAACGGDDNEGSTTDESRSSDAPAQPTPAEAEEAAADRLAGSSADVAGQGAATGVAGGALGTCLEAAGFASGPPGHGIVAQWTHPDGAVVAQSTDPTQAGTQVAEFSSAEAPAKVVGDGIIVGGSGPSATAAEACATA